MVVRYGTNVIVGTDVTGGTGFSLDDYFSIVFDADINVSVSAGNAVDSWTDTRGIYTFTGTGSTRPTLTVQNTDFKNQPTIDFDLDQLSGPSSFAALFNGDDIPHEIYWVIRKNGGAGSDFIWTAANSGNTESVRLSTGATSTWAYQRTAVGEGLQSTASNTFSNGVTDLWGVEFQGTTAQFYNQTATFGNGAVDANALVNLTTTFIGANTAGGQNADIDLAFIGWKFGNPLTDNQRANFSDYCERRWGLTAV